MQIVRCECVWEAAEIFSNFQGMFAWNHVLFKNASRRQRKKAHKHTHIEGKHPEQQQWASKQIKRICHEIIIIIFLSVSVYVWLWRACLSNGTREGNHTKRKKKL